MQTKLEKAKEVTKDVTGVALERVTPYVTKSRQQLGDISDVALQRVTPYVEKSRQQLEEFKVTTLDTLDKSPTVIKIRSSEKAQRANKALNFLLSGFDNVLQTVAPDSEDYSENLKTLRRSFFDSIQNAAIVMLLALSALAGLAALGLAFSGTAALSTAAESITGVIFDAWTYLSVATAIGGAGYIGTNFGQFKYVQNQEKKLALKNNEVTPMMSNQTDVNLESDAPVPSLELEKKVEVDEATQPILDISASVMLPSAGSEEWQPVTQTSSRSPSPTPKATMS